MEEGESMNEPKDNVYVVFESLDGFEHDLVAIFVTEEAAKQFIETAENKGEFHEKGELSYAKHKVRR
jgi:hypothetical protein